MASSTTSPTANTTANMESTLIENPNMYMMKKEPMSDTGITIHGINVTRQSRKNRKMITITNTKATYTVSFTSEMEARMNLVLSNP